MGIVSEPNTTNQLLLPLSHTSGATAEPAPSCSGKTRPATDALERLTSQQPSKRRRLLDDLFPSSPQRGAGEILPMTDMFLGLPRPTTKEVEDKDECPFPSLSSFSFPTPAPSELVSSSSEKHCTKPTTGDTEHPLSTVTTTNLKSSCTLSSPLQSSFTFGLLKSSQLGKLSHSRGLVRSRTIRSSKVNTTSLSSLCLIDVDYPKFMLS